MSKIQKKHKPNGFKCSFCKKELVGRQKRYCSDTCKSNWFEKRREEMLNDFTPEEFHKFVNSQKAFANSKTAEISRLKKHLEYIRNYCDKVLESNMSEITKGR